MVTFNLLAWREQQIRYEKRICQYLILGAVIGAIIVLGCADQYLSARQATLAAHIDSLRKELSWREGLVKNTQYPIAPQENMLNFFRRLNQMSAQDVCFEQIKKTKSGIELMGLATSAEPLTHFLQHSSFVSYFAEIKVNKLRPHNGQVKFNLLGRPHAL